MCSVDGQGCIARIRARTGRPRASASQARPVQIAEYRYRRLPDCGAGLGAATHVTGAFAFAAVGKAIEMLLTPKRAG